MLSARQVAAVGQEAARRPALHLHHGDDIDGLAHAVGQRGVELHEVEAGPHAAEAQQVACVLQREQVLAGRDGAGVGRRHRRIEGEVQGVARLLVPGEAVGRHRLAVLERGRLIEAAVGVHREPRAVAAEQRQHRLDPCKVVVQGGAADLHLDLGVALVEIALHLGDEAIRSLVRVVVAAGGVDRDAPLRRGVAGVFGDQRPERHVAELGGGVPDGDVQRRHRDRALAVAAGLLVPHHQAADGAGVEGGAVGARVLLRRFQHAGREPLADHGALGVAAVGVEAEAHHGLAAAHRVGDDGDRAHGHLAEVDDGVPHRRAHGHGDVTDFHDPHGYAPGTSDSSVQSAAMRRRSAWASATVTWRKR